MSTQWLTGLDPSWEARRPNTLFRERREPSWADDVHLTPSQTHGVVSQADYMEMTGTKVVLNLTGADNMKHVEPDDFIIHLRSFQGGIEHSTVRGKVSNAYTVLAPASEFEPRYYRWVLKSSGLIQELRSTTEQLRDGQSIKFDQFRSLRLPVPPLDEQRRIADFLDDQVTRIDNIVAARRRQVDLLAVAERLAVRDGVAGSGLTDETRSSGVDWVGPLHPEATLRPLARLLTLQRGADLTDDERVEGDVPVITTAGVVGTHNRIVARGPGVVIGRYGTVGNVHWVESDFWAHNTTLYVKDFLGNDPRWVYYSLRAYPYEMLQARAAVPGINRNDMSGDLMAWLPVRLQRDAVRSIDSSLASLAEGRKAFDRSIGLLTERKRSLITAAVTGELDVTTARAGAPA